MTTERFIEFLDEFIVDEYRNHLIIVDNAGAHRNEDVRRTINESGNELLYAEHMRKSYQRNVVVQRYINRYIFKNRRFKSSRV